MAGVEEFTILAILEARDKATDVMERISGALEQFDSAAERAAEVARASGEQIDQGLLQTASGADAVTLGAAKVEAAANTAAAATREQAAAEQELIAAREAGATESELAAAMTRLTAAEKESIKATADLNAVQARQAEVARASAIANGEAAAGATEATAAQRRLAAASDLQGSSLGKASKMAGTMALGLGVVAALSIKAAGDFQSLTQHLVTDAGESQKNLAMVQKGILSLSSAVGTSTTELTNGMYHIESAGFHGAAGLKLLQTAAEGAKVGGADLDTVSKALTGTMNAYGAGADKATSYMNGLIKAVGSGDMKMEDLASSLGNVAPLAAAAGIQFSDIAGAIATMTAQNMSAHQATQDLANTIGNLQKPSKIAVDEMQMIGLNANDVSKNLGKNGLVGTLQTLTQTLAAHTKGGEVFVNSLKNSTVAAQNAKLALAAMPASLAALSQKLLDGSITAKQYTGELGKMPLSAQVMGQQFKGMAKQADGFNSLLKSGSPAAETYNAALAKMLGGSTGLNTALMITGGRLQTTKDNAATVAKAMKEGGNSVDDWSKIQGTFNQKVDRAKESVVALGISLGTALLPIVSKLMDMLMKVLSPIVSWISKNQQLVGLIFAVVTAVLAAVGAIKLASMAMALFNAVMDANPISLIIIAIAALVVGIIYAYTHFKTFRDIVNAVMNFVKVVVMAVVDAVIIAFKAVATAAIWVWHALETAWHAVASAAESVWHAISGAWNSIVNVTMTVFNSIVGFFQKWWPLLLVIFLPPIAILLALWNHFHKDVFDAAETTWNAISGFFVGIWHWITGAAKAAWNLFAKYVIDPVKQVWAEIQGPIHSVEHFLSSVWNTVKSLAAKEWHGIKIAIIDPIEDVWNKVSSIFTKVKNVISTQLSQAWAAVKGIGSKFLSIGNDIVQGIIKGIEGAGSALFNTLKNLAGDALNAAKSFLGIGSPSKEFADQVGQWIPHGVAMGVSDHTPVAQQAVSKMASTLTTAAKTALSLPTLMPLAASASVMSTQLTANGRGGSGQVVNFNFDLRNSSVMTDRDMDALVNKIGKRVATQILPSGGVRIQM